MSAQPTANVITVHDSTSEAHTFEVCRPTQPQTLKRSALLNSVDCNVGSEMRSYATGSASGGEFFMDQN